MTTQDAATAGAESGTGAADGAQVRKLGQLGVSVKDLETMTAFYRDAVGLRFLFAAPGMSFFDLGGVRLMLSLPETGSEHRHGSILYLDVADIAAAHAALLARASPSQASRTSSTATRAASCGSRSSATPRRTCWR
jgi:catechol-2,3-dioxygenase